MIRGLFCGVSEYRGNQQLSYCKNDAQAMKKAFLDNFICSDDSVEVLAEDGSIDNDEYISKIRLFSEKCEKDDIAVVYYSGHGSVDERGDNYLFATNTFDGNEYSCVYLDVIIGLIKRSKAKSKLVILDCCHAASHFGSEQQKFDINKAIEDIYQVGITMIFSCQKEEESHPYYDGRISAFTQFFCDAICYKNSYQPEGLYLSDVKLTIDAYARAWNMRNESKKQTPVLYSNMIGTIVLPLQRPKKMSERKRMGLVFDIFDAINFQWQVKSPKTEYQKIYTADIIAKVDIDDNNIIEFSEYVIKKLKTLRIRPETRKQLITEQQPVDSVQLWVAKDYFDVGYDRKNFAYRVCWDKNSDLYWSNQLGKDRIQIGNMAYWKNTDYNTERENRKKYVLPDNVIKKFWSDTLYKLVTETESFLYEYNNYYLNKEISYVELKAKATVLYRKLGEEYKNAFHAWWPLPDSSLKEYSKQSSDLALDIQEMLFLFLGDKGEDWVIDNLKLKIENYYKELHRWKEILDNIENVD